MTFYDINDSDRVSKKSNIRQLVDVLQSDVSSIDQTDSSIDLKTRKKYEVFVTGGISPLEGSVTSSIFQTVFDQDYDLQTSNEMLDITIGNYQSSETVKAVNGADDGSGNWVFDTDSSGKLIFGDDVLMMREKISIYKQYAQVLLGNSESAFYTPFESTLDADRIEDAIFINFKRLFVRDGLEKEQFSIRLHRVAPFSDPTDNIDVEIDETTNEATFLIYTDAGSSSNLNVSTISGHIGFITNDSGTKVGLIFYNKGIVILDAKKVFDPDGVIKGNISSVNDASNEIAFQGALIPNFWVSGSIDNVIDHIASTRFGRSNKSAIGYINQTSINSTLYFCRVGPNDANFSTNPTFTDDDGNLRCINNRGDDPFSYITTIGLYDSAGDLLAVAKTSRPIEKNPEVDLSISVRLDY